MAYTPPLHDQVNFVLDGNYTPPLHDQINFIFGDEGTGAITLTDGVTLSDSISVKILFKYSLNDGIILSDDLVNKTVTVREFFESNIKFSDSFFIGNFILNWKKRIKAVNTEIVGYRIKVYKRSTQALLRTIDQVVSDPDNFDGEFVYTRSMNITDNGSFVETDLNFVVYQLNGSGFYSPPTIISI